MRYALCLLLFACSSEEPQEIQLPPDLVAAGSAPAPALEAPTDGRPDTTTAPPSGERLPPLEPPEGQRERDWEWEFANKGKTKRSHELHDHREREKLTAEDLEAIELGKMEPPQWMLDAANGEPQ
jgi:hypothetical protein